MSAANLKILRDRMSEMHGRTLMDALGIEFTYIGEDSIRATMPVDGRTVQYANMLHGGASVALAESLASCGGCLHVDLTRQTVVGLEINANHIRGVPCGGGKLLGEGRPLHLGKKTQVWSIEIKNEAGQLVCSSRCTLAVVDRPG